LLAIGTVDELLRQEGGIDLRVPDASAAEQVLRTLPWVTAVDRTDGYLRVSAPPNRASEVNQALAAAGVFASEIRPRERSLEAFFLEVTGEGEKA
jgi:hypothetical protein